MSLVVTPLVTNCAPAESNIPVKVDDPPLAEAIPSLKLGILILVLTANEVPVEVGIATPGSCKQSIVVVPTETISNASKPPVIKTSLGRIPEAVKSLLADVKVKVCSC